MLKILKKRQQVGKFKKEFIFVDDGSTDRSLEVLRREIKTLRNSKIVQQKNCGSANATNVGIKLARMKYIKFLDADDVILSDTTDALINILEKNSKCVLAYGFQRKVSNLADVNLSEKIPYNDFSIIKNPIKKAMRNSMFNPSQCLVRTELCKRVGGCDERIKFSQEYSLTLKLSLLGDFAKLNFPIAILPFKVPGQ